MTLVIGDDINVSLLLDTNREAPSATRSIDKYSKTYPTQEYVVLLQERVSHVEKALIHQF